MKWIYSQEVQQAFLEKKPIVALESSVICQGFPAPHNLEVARACENVVRELKAVPATIAVIDGVVCVGLVEAQLQQLADKSIAKVKIAARDLPAAIVDKKTGGTTVSATCLVAARCGIEVFSTGGIGGVHRGVLEHDDVSADLEFIAHSPVAVVCAGAKTILDLPRTLERLETLGVAVVGVQTSDFPGFFVQKTGLSLELRVESAREAARLWRTHHQWMPERGMLFAVPPEEVVSLSSQVVDAAIEQALVAAKKDGISGKALTPYLLSHLVQATGGVTLKTNKALLLNNARFAAGLTYSLKMDAA